MKHCSSSIETTFCVCTISGARFFALKSSISAELPIDTILQNMIKGAVSVVDQTSFMYHVSALVHLFLRLLHDFTALFPYLAAVNLYGNSSFLPSCHLNVRMPHLQCSPDFCDDPERDEDHKEPKKERASSRMHSSIDLQQIAEKQGNKVTMLDKLKTVHLHILAMEQWNASRLNMCHRNYSASAINVLHYLALKSLDTEQIKEELSSIGLMNLETINTHVLSSLVGCIEMLINSRPESLLGLQVSSEGFPVHQSLVDKNVDLGMTAMVKKASSNRDILLGKLPNQKMAHVMVTVGQEAAENDTDITDLVNSGATIFRINCAHGNPERLKAGPCVVKISPKRNALGSVIRGAQVWLSPQGAGPPPSHLSPDVILQVDGEEFLSKLEVDDSVRFTDARGKHRSLQILIKYPVFSGAGVMAECSKPAYLESGTALYIKEKGKKSSGGFLVDVPPAKQFVRLRVGGLLVLSRDSSDEQDTSLYSAVGTHKMTCPCGYLFDSVKPGDPIAFDDGKIWGVIKGNIISEVVVTITHADPKGTKLGSEKSINIPQSDIPFEGLTSKDLMDLDFVAAHADMVGISFFRDVHDIVVLRQELSKRKFSKLGIVLKIETQGGFEKLPLLILEAMKSGNPLGVMIARGDLAVECGWEKLADVQEEIMSICSASRIPVVLATQVLESLVKTGVPTRAEITDAANGRRASCVMLNKGKHIAEAVSTLDTILNSQCTNAKAELKPLMLANRVD
ncbi:hypothetical protein SASPL_157018 [Salvia splendens]|uniref:Pyruvate kinase n=1 Tax=Salvia splendens TaxID=180675 RepID=A0A8X8VVM8_SALSN|nr:hypothetical protein SASPL_157018 [Salvia splendens]